MTRRELAIEVIRWEGGEIVDSVELLRELVKVFHEAEALRRIEEVIG